MNVYGLGVPDKDKFQRMWTGFQGPALGHAPILGRPGAFPHAPEFRVGWAYGDISAAEYETSGKLSKPGKGEIFLQRLYANGEDVKDGDISKPQKALSIIDSVIEDGKMVLCYRDHTLYSDDIEKKNQALAGWVVFRVEPPAPLYGAGTMTRTSYTLPTATGALINVPGIGITSVNSNEAEPVVSFQVAGMGPTTYDRILVNYPGIYRWTFDVKCELPTSPAEPPLGGGRQRSYQNKILPVTGTNNPATNAVTGTTDDACLWQQYIKKRFWLLKNASFTTPAVTDGLSMAEVWFKYDCSVRSFSFHHDSDWAVLEPGDSISIWWDSNHIEGLTSWGDLLWQFRVSVHLSEEIELEV